MSTRHPLRSRAVVSLIVAAIAATAVKLGADAVKVAEWVEVVGYWLAAAVASGMVVVTGEPAVTPVADPRTADGRLAELVPIYGEADAA